MSLKKLVIAHSNDLHGDFLAKEVDHQLLGGVSMLSGYLNRLRKEEKNVVYAVSGDMFKGSLIDSHYKGLSTIEIMNLLSPDVVTIGNHEVDYGVAHLLFLERCAKFPIINANMYLKNNNVRLFRSHKILHIDGMKILFIGVLTEEVLAKTRQEEMIGALIDVKAAAREIGKICNTYRTTDIDLTVLLTHIGIEADKELAALLDPRWGVDLIIGGHSHTLLEEPVIVEGIPIVQAAEGTGQVGKFEILVDTENNRIHSYTWKLIPINGDNCPRDAQLEHLIQFYKEQTDERYSRIITRFLDSYTHPARNQETEMGRIFSDMLRDSTGVDIMMLASGSIRKKESGTIITLKDLLELFPFDDELYQITVTGAQLKTMLLWMLREEAFTGHTEFYQLSGGLRVIYSRSTQRIQEFTFQEKAIKPEQLFTIALQRYHFDNMEDFFHMSRAEVEQNGKIKMLSTSCRDVLDEWMSQMELVRLPEDERLIIIE